MLQKTTVFKQENTYRYKAYSNPLSIEPKTIKIEFGKRNPRNEKEKC